MSEDIAVEVTRFTPYDGPKGNALGFADAVVTFSDGTSLEFDDLKLYRAGKAGLKVSEKQVRDENIPSKWVKVPPLIPDEAYQPLREALIWRHEYETSDEIPLF